MSQTRVPPGVSSGGQFTHSVRDESGATLARPGMRPFKTGEGVCWHNPSTGEPQSVEVVSDDGGTDDYDLVSVRQHGASEFERFDVLRGELTGGESVGTNIRAYGLDVGDVVLVEGRYRTVTGVDRGTSALSIHFDDGASKDYIADSVVEVFETRELTQAQGLALNPGRLSPTVFDQEFSPLINGEAGSSEFQIVPYGTDPSCVWSVIRREIPDGRIDRVLLPGSHADADAFVLTLKEWREGMEVDWN